MKQYMKFFLVWNEKTGYTEYKNTNYHLAAIEARRLASENEGQKFHVLETKSSFVVNSLTEEVAADFTSDPTL